MKENKVQNQLTGKSGEVTRILMQQILLQFFLKSMRCNGYM